VREISGGEAQRVALGRALAFGPRVLLLDEPLSALDAPLRDSLRTQLRRLLADLGMTTVYVTHDQGEALGLGDELVLLNKGAIEQADAPSAIYSRPATRFAAEFLGSANVFRADCLEGAGGRILRLPFLEIAPPPDLAPGAYWAVLRPEDFEVASEDEHFRAECLSATFRGPVTRISLRAGGQELVADVPGDLGLEPRPEWKFRVKTEKIRLIPIGGGTADRRLLSPESA